MNDEDTIVLVKRSQMFSYRTVHMELEIVAANPHALTRVAARLAGGAPAEDDFQLEPVCMLHETRAGVEPFTCRRGCRARAILF